ncbi:nucleotide exchange factor GrpE [Luteimonas sp. M1R5S18]|jgi:molecular chaperone GrpE|uniref:Protein GrpE n=1 Tax=Luteimonas rhizosphaericola TaxID=3042024 RepID=A0ABT6JGT1_9GAMM|nr:nucleotide exchange factor GrpE [Luteimonas rhizosphaericola]MDH5829864.1 nucleotide exchange factor GrpE [Luteimonas rhizosphaericola]
MTTEPMHDAAPAAEDTLAPEARIQALEAELEQLRAQSLVDRADLENQRKRMERDVRNACRFANKQLLGDLLPVFDSLEAALVNAPAEDPLRDGVVLTLRELTRVCENNGLVEVAPSQGEGFDPERHQAMSAVETDQVPPGAVVQVFQKGYVLNEQLLRPALVAVAKHD